VVLGAEDSAVAEDLVVVVPEGDEHRTLQIPESRSQWTNYHFMTFGNDLNAILAVII
jgi:hypothetical protein